MENNTQLSRIQLVHLLPIIGYVGYAYIGYELFLYLSVASLSTIVFMFSISHGAFSGLVSATLRGIDIKTLIKTKIPYQPYSYSKRLYIMFLMMVSTFLMYDLGYLMLTSASVMVMISEIMGILTFFIVSEKDSLPEDFDDI